MNCLLAVISYILTLKHVSDDILYLLDRSIWGKSCIKNIDIISDFSVKICFCRFKVEYQAKFLERTQNIEIREATLRGLCCNFAIGFHLNS